MQQRQRLINISGMVAVPGTCKKEKWNNTMKAFYKTMIITILLTGCAKTAPEIATEAALNQVSAVEAKIKQECPQAKIDKDIIALQSSIKSQYASCEERLQTYQEKNNTLWLAIISMIGLWLFANWAKIKGRFFK